MEYSSSNAFLISISNFVFSFCKIMNNCLIFCLFTVEMGHHCCKYFLKYGFSGFKNKFLRIQMILWVNLSDNYGFYNYLFYGKQKRIILKIILFFLLNYFVVIYHFFIKIVMKLRLQHYQVLFQNLKSLSLLFLFFPYLFAILAFFDFFLLD